MDKPIVSSEQFTIEANAKRFANSADSERSYKMTSSERKAARDRKREQRQRIKDEEERARHAREIEADQLRMQTKREQTGLAGWNEIVAGVQARTREEEFQVACEFARLLGPFSLGESAGAFCTRVYWKYLRDGMPLLDRSNHQLVQNLDKDAILTSEGFQHGEYSPCTVAAQLVEIYRAGHLDEWWSIKLPVDPRAAHLVQA